jgi:hypothetical protein
VSEEGKEGMEVDEKDLTRKPPNPKMGFDPPLPGHLAPPVPITFGWARTRKQKEPHESGGFYPPHPGNLKVPKEGPDLAGGLGVLGLVVLWLAGLAVIALVLFAVVKWAWQTVFP